MKDININETLKNKIFLKYLLYSVFIVLTVKILFMLLQIPHVMKFFINIENQTFDVRQNIIAKYKKTNLDIKIIAIDDASYEYVLDKYGEWPVKRGIYADMAEYLESQDASVIAYDLLFVKSLKSSRSDDLKLAKSIAKHDNIFTSINFDNQDASLRKPADLPDYLKVKIKNESNLNLKSPIITFDNCRVIIPEILNNTPNIGHINAIREDDGIIRNFLPFAVYKDDHYPHLALKVAIKYLQNKNNFVSSDFRVNKNGDVVVGDKVIPITNFGTAILNWYGPSGSNGGNTFEYVPFWKVLKTMSGEERLIPDNYFKGKIVYIGTSTTSLFDIKSVPTDKLFPGVETHTTFVNNLLDNNFIKRVPPQTDIFVCMLLSLFTGLMVVRMKSTILSSLITILTAIIYLVLSTLLMFYFNIWIGVSFALLSMAIAFTGVYIAKYILKSRDFEYTYALATTDGLTELYNHRYFQEQMIHHVETAKRYNSEFSLIIIDIDYFKKFNDNYGHQSGDAVLKQVAQVLKKNVRATDIVCRYGGEEMTIILSNTNNKDAKITAQKICDAVAQKPFKLANDVEKNVTISLGVATYPQNGDNPQSLIKHADACLYKAKENGRNQVGCLDGEKV